MFKCYLYFNVKWSYDRRSTNFISALKSSDVMILTNGQSLQCCQWHLPRENIKHKLCLCQLVSAPCQHREQDFPFSDLIIIIIRGAAWCWVACIWFMCGSCAHDQRKEVFLNTARRLQCQKDWCFRGNKQSTSCDELCTACMTYEGKTASPLVQLPLNRNLHAVAKRKFS